MERIDTVKKIIEGMNERGKLYWLKVLADQGYISKSEAGFILIYK